MNQVVLYHIYVGLSEEGLFPNSSVSNKTTWTLDNNAQHLVGPLINKRSRGGPACELALPSSFTANPILYFSSWFHLPGTLSCALHPLLTLFASRNSHQGCIIHQSFGSIVGPYPSFPPTFSSSYNINLYRMRGAFLREGRKTWGISYHVLTKATWMPLSWLYILANILS